MSKIKFRLVFLVFVFSISPITAYAYIDPSSSLLIIQGVLAFFGALVVFVKNPIKSIKNLIKKFRNSSDA